MFGDGVFQGLGPARFVGRVGALAVSDVALIVVVAHQCADVPRIATSVSSSRMRLFAAASSACSERFRPGS